MSTSSKLAFFSRLRCIHFPPLREESSPGIYSCLSSPPHVLHAITLDTSNVLFSGKENPPRFLDSRGSKHVLAPEGLCETLAAVGLGLFLSYAIRLFSPRKGLWRMDEGSSGAFLPPASLHALASILRVAFRNIGYESSAGLDLRVISVGSSWFAGS